MMFTYLRESDPADANPVTGHDRRRRALGPDERHRAGCARRPRLRPTPLLVLTAAPSRRAPASLRWDQAAVPSHADISAARARDPCSSGPP